MKKLLKRTGLEGKQTVFLFTDTQIVHETFLEVSALLLLHFYCNHQALAIDNLCSCGLTKVDAACNSISSNDCTLSYVLSAMQHEVCMSQTAALIQNNATQYISWTVRKHASQQSLIILEVAHTFHSYVVQNTHSPLVANRVDCDDLNQLRPLGKLSLLKQCTTDDSAPIP